RPSALVLLACGFLCIAGPAPAQFERAPRSDDTLPAGALVRLKKTSSNRAGHPTVTGVAFAPDGKFLAAADDRGTIRLWEPGTGKELPRRWERRSDCRRLALAPDGKLLAAAGWGGRISLFDVATGEVRVHIQAHQEAINAVAFS